MSLPATDHLHELPYLCGVPGLYMLRTMGFPSSVHGSASALRLCTSHGLNIHPFESVSKTPSRHMVSKGCSQTWAMSASNQKVSGSSGTDGTNKSGHCHLHGRMDPSWMECVGQRGLSSHREANTPYEASRCLSECLPPSFPRPSRPQRLQ